MGKQRNKIIAFLLVLVMLLPQTITSYAATDIPVGITIASSPKLVEYCVNDTINTRGLSLAVSYQSGNVKIISAGYELGYDFSTAGKKDVEVSYTESDVTVNTSFPVTVYERPLLTSEDTEVTSGTILTVPVMIEKNCGLMGMELQVTYDASYLTPLSVENTDIFATGSVNDNIGVSKTNTVSVIWTGTEAMSNDGKLCDISFYCKDVTQAETTTVEIAANPVNTFNENYSTITFEGTTCTVDIQKGEQDGKKTLSKLAVTMEGWTEGETANKPELIGNKGNGKVTYYYGESFDGEYQTEVPTAAGRYFLKAVVEETDEYQSGTAYCIFRIAKAADVWPFKDVDENAGNWKYESVKYVYEHKLMTGKKSDTFAPNDAITREEFVVVLYRMAGNPDVEAIDTPFQDVVDTKYYRDAVLWAYQNGIATGTSKTTFGIGQSIKRDEMAKMMYQYAVINGYDVSGSATLSSFADESKVSSWAQKYLSWAVSAGMISGKKQSNRYYLDPKGNATRAETAAILMRFMQAYE